MSRRDWAILLIATAVSVLTSVALLINDAVGAELRLESGEVLKVERRPLLRDRATVRDERGRVVGHVVPDGNGRPGRRKLIDARTGRAIIKWRAGR